MKLKMLSPPMELARAVPFDYNRVHPHLRRARINLAPFIPPKVVSDADQPRTG